MSGDKHRRLSKGGHQARTKGAKQGNPKGVLGEHTSTSLRGECKGERDAQRNTSKRPNHKSGFGECGLNIPSTEAHGLRGKAVPTGSTDKRLGHGLPGLWGAGEFMAAEVTAVMEAREER